MTLRLPYADSIDKTIIQRAFGKLPSMHIRLATTSDRDSVLKLFDEFSKLLGSLDTPSKIGRAVFDEIVSDNSTKIFVAEEDNKLYGLATLYLLPNIRHGWHRGHIEDLFVSKKNQRTGVGTLILNAIKQYCRSNNVRVIKLDSGNELKEAHQFYKKNGGKTTETFFRFDLE
ncbi:MAG: GNAT family N-acetyltransferase [Candidatus Dormibacteraceae bacterium]